MQHLELIEKKTIMLTVMAVLFFSAVNQTIVGTALPKIVSSLGGMEYFNWVFTIFMLSSSIASILAGRLSDHYGRKPFFIFGILSLILGSLLCGFSESMIQLIIFRGFQGVGAGIIISLSFASVGDLFHQKERGKWQGWLTSVFGLSSLVGPTMGGYISDHFHWNWIFWIFLPLGFIAFFVMIRYYPRQNITPSKLVIDYAGTAVFTLSISSLLYYISILGIEKASMQREGILLFGIIMLIWFVMIELKAEDPVIPLFLFKKNTFLVSNTVSFFLGMGMFGVIIYIPFFMQGVMQVSATDSGIVMMAMTLSMVAASTLGGNVISRTGSYRILGAVGIILMIIGLFLMSLMKMDSGIWDTFFRVVIFGAGLGTSFTVFTLSVQFEVEKQNIGVAVSSVQLFRQIGGTAGVAMFSGIFGSLMNERIQKMSSLLNSSILPESAKRLLSNPKILLNQNALYRMTEGQSGTVLEKIRESIFVLRENMGAVLNDVFLVSTYFLIFSLIISLFLKEVVLEEK
ncbi:MAG TPA: MDR family MFS transporter [Leptospiraceae bacterium]|nr:MDR family MFS transporter [Leptospiraceae bacterium]